MPVQDDGMSDPIYYQVRCSKCGFDLDPQTWHMELHKYGADKYCPKCGFRMVEPQESESKRYMELAKSYVQGLRTGLAES